MSETGQKSVGDKDLTVEKNINERKASSLDINRLGKFLYKAAAVAFFVPLLALNVIAMTRSIDGIISSAEARTGEYGGEFDPSMGAEVESQNGRALVVVHEGFGMDTAAWKWKDDPAYAEYMRVLQATKERYYENGDVVVLVFDEKAWYDGDHIPEDNTLYFSTQSNNGQQNSSVVEDGVSYSQSYERLFETLKEAGVDTVEMAGEFRGLCVTQVAQAFKEANFKMGWCAECAFPAVDQMSDPSAFPTLEPLDN